MKVIHDKYNGKPIETTCKCCSSVLEYTQQDIHVIAEIYVNSYYIICPLCKFKMQVEKSNSR